MPRPQKEERVREIAEDLRRAQAAVLTDYRGLTVQDAAELRASLDEVETRFAIVKNTLTKLALDQAGRADGLTELLEGPTAIAFVYGDPVAGVKRLVDSAKRFPVLEIKGGFAEGRALSADDVRSLAALESREAMLAKIAGLAKIELQRTAWILQGLQSRFVSLMQALQDKLPGEDGPTEPQAAPSDGPDTGGEATETEGGTEGG